jgi:hypothetical protein
VPYEIAFSLPDDERIAQVIIMGTLTGHVFDWATMRWLDA